MGGEIAGQGTYNQGVKLWGNPQGFLNFGQVLSDGVPIDGDITRSGNLITRHDFQGGGFALWKRQQNQHSIFLWGSGRKA